ncbi:MAG: gephyrin-like molybdotransferase Glp [Nitrospinota bacterium]
MSEPRPAMRPLKKFLSFAEAKAIALEAVSPVEGTETLALEDATGRVLAEEVRAPQDVPNFAQATMDGYALIAEETVAAAAERPALLTCQEVIYAGHVPTRPVSPGSCSQIATGAMIPDGADAVVMVEDTERESERVFIHRPLQPGENISPEGHDFQAGDLVVADGSLLSPSRLGALATVGCPTVVVYAKPRVAIIPTGDEVVTLDRELEPGQVYTSNSYTLAGAVTLFGGEPVIHPDIVGDDSALLMATIKSYADCDVIVLSGGSSVGERDLVVDAFNEVGQILFHGIAIKPGKTTILASAGHQLLLGMPGFPSSCLSNAYVLLGPMLLKMARLPGRELATVRLSLAAPVTSEPGRHQFFTVRITDGMAHPAFKTSGAITSMSEADGFIEIPAGVDRIEQGEKVLVHLF